MNGTHIAAGALVRATRRDLGWTHQQMCAEILRHPRLGPRYAISARTIANVEAGRVRRPYVRAEFAICTVLGLKPSHVWGDN